MAQTPNPDNGKLTIEYLMNRYARIPSLTIGNGKRADFSGQKHKEPLLVSQGKRTRNMGASDQL